MSKELDIRRLGDFSPKAFPPAEPFEGEINWANLVAEEPELGRLLDDIRSLRPGRNFCANRVWYGYHDPDRHDFRERMCGTRRMDRAEPEAAIHGGVRRRLRGALRGAAGLQA